MPTPKKSLGQHWLFDSKSLGAISDAADLQPADTVLEIGPGLGPLTIELTQRAKQVIAVELDDQLARELPGRVPAANLRVMHGDILQFDLSQLPLGYKVVANVPYYITSHLVRLLVTSPTPPSAAVLLVQKEVAQRLAAQPGNMNMLGLSAQLYAHVRLGPIITRDKFSPPPKVDSQVVVLQLRDQPLFADATPQHLLRIAKAGFAEKRKTLRNSLSGGLHIDKTQAVNLLKKAGIPATQRAEALSLNDWHRLAHVIKSVLG